MPSLAIDREFLREYPKLDKAVQERVTEAFAKFEQATHTGQHLEKVKNARDNRFRTIRITQFWRGVVLAPETGSTYTLLKVLPHDDAYTWAQRRLASVNAATGRIEIRDVTAIESTLPGLSGIAEMAPARLFDDVNDADLRRLGIDEQTLAFARVLTDPVQLDAARSFLPSGQWDALAGLAAGLSPEEVWAELGDVIYGQRFDPNDLSAAVARSSDRMVLVDGPEELLAIFRHPFALWRIYLHPVQRTTVDAHFRGSARVTGGPGTGKTVVALHRSNHLARLNNGQVLLTTFTSTLTGSLSAGLKLLIESDEIRSRIDVKNVDQLAHQVFREEHGAPRLLDSDEESALWRSVIDRLDLPFSEPFLRQEWRQVVLAQKVTSAQEYLSAKRTGRGRRLGPRQKAQVWQAIWEFEQQLRDGDWWTHETVCVEAERLLEQRTEKPYQHIVVDEAQDLSPSQWRLLRAAVPRQPNDVFLAGDTHQRIYSHLVSLREVGIHVAGRSSRLTVNYRTTAEILSWSLGLLRGEPIDDMDGGLDSIAGCRSEMHGMPPELKEYRNKNAELDGLSTTVRMWLDAGVEPGEIGVAARAKWLVEAAVDALEAVSIPVRSLLGAKAPDDAVAVGTMHRMKGLEFRCLAVIGVSEHQVPPSSAITPLNEDEATHHQDMRRERCLLFVACTRSREQLAVSWHGASSKLLSGLK
ncbi:UvrD-helicase domain-containing protein [Amycolatopsis anabasis]|uniref:UvrD-helicase domain-containing protein n=1 Tax=Amycolatopsis anabasis TaxID=1840409 RepID=UPI00131DE16F|nr:UvrD-helicase domain-containing protein [Amycolatopsis anabasis]